MAKYDFGEAGDLFAAPNQGQKSWQDRMTDEQKEWLEWVAANAEKVRRLPSWKATTHNFKKNFPGEYCPSHKTVARHVRTYLRDTERGDWLPDGE